MSNDRKVRVRFLKHVEFLTVEGQEVNAAIGDEVELPHRAARYFIENKKAEEVAT